MKRRREWLLIAVREGSLVMAGAPLGSSRPATLYYLNGTGYTDLDEPLRLARKRAEAINKPMRIWKKDNDILLATYRTSSKWGVPHTEKLPLEKIWPIFETYARML